MFGVRKTRFLDQPPKFKNSFSHLLVKLFGTNVTDFGTLWAILSLLDNGAHQFGRDVGFGSSRLILGRFGFDDGFVVGSC